MSIITRYVRKPIIAESAIILPQKRGILSKWNAMVRAVEGKRNLNFIGPYCTGEGHVHLLTSYILTDSTLLLQRIGYLAATQCFHEGLDVVMLTTNMIRKDISTHNQYDASLALNGLACFMTPDLARWALIGTMAK